MKKKLFKELPLLNMLKPIDNDYSLLENKESDIKKSSSLPIKTKQDPVPSRPSPRYF